MDAEEFVTERGEKREERKFGPNVAQLAPSPIDLRISEMKTALKIISCDGRDITLSPAPSIDKRLIYPDKSNENRDKPDRDGHVYLPILCHEHNSPLDKGTSQSQSSTSASWGKEAPAMKKQPHIVCLSAAIGLAA